MRTIQSILTFILLKKINIISILFQFIAIFCSFCLLSCGNNLSKKGNNLSKKEAQKVIVKELNYPIEFTAFAAPITSKSSEDGGYFDSFQKIINDEKYFIKSKIEEDEKGNKRIRYKPTEIWGGNYCNADSKEFHFSFEGVPVMHYSINATVAFKKVKEVEEVLIDEKNLTAKVTYSTYIEKAEPGYSILCKNGDACFGIPFDEDGKNLWRTEKIILKKYDKGWRVKEEF